MKPINEIVAKLRGKAVGQNVGPAIYLFEQAADLIEQLSAHAEAMADSMTRGIDNRLDAARAYRKWRDE